MILSTIFIERWRCIDPLLDWYTHQEWDHNDIDIIWIVDTCSQAFREKLRDWRKNEGRNYRSLRWIEVLNTPVKHQVLYEGCGSTRQKRDQVAENFALIFKYAREKKDYLFIVEDDTVPVFYDCIDRLYNVLHSEKDILVTGVPVRVDYRGKGADRWNLWEIRDKKVLNLGLDGNDIMRVDASGTPCTLIHKDLLTQTDYLPKANYPFHGPCGQDIYMGYMIKEQYNGKWLIDTTQRAWHYLNYKKDEVVRV